MPATGPQSPTRPTGSTKRSEHSEDEIVPIIDSEHGSIRSYNATSEVMRSTGSSSVTQTQTGSASGSNPTEISPDNGGQSSSPPLHKRRRTGKQDHAAAKNEDDRDGDDGTSWWKVFVEKYGAVELDNKGSVARDHLALERTFLAWLRTSLSFASIGVAITQLFRLNTTITERDGLNPEPDTSSMTRLRQMGKPLGATFLAISIVILFIGWRRYFESQYWIIRGKFPASRGSVFLVTFVAAALIIASLVIVVLVNPTQFEKR